ncbi:MAG: DUF3565 domain-containing protein [Nitrospirales bacterium]|nr:DUF3565 domain-containing protein [Nitrospira sp.]MDR4500048.1 DUF3565 domain-containing protein [Nitrospirales bacterium]
MNQPIIGYHLDEEGDWVADLACGHGQHVRHNPPWSVRTWVLSEEGRKEKLGEQLNCKRCEEPMEEPIEDSKDKPENF